jgi:hypothetical protein
MAHTLLVPGRTPILEEAVRVALVVVEVVLRKQMEAVGELLQTLVEAAVEAVQTSPRLSPHRHKLFFLLRGVSKFPWHCGVIIPSL